MKKKLLNGIVTLTVLLVCICLLPTKAQAASESDLTFTLNSDGTSYSVTDCVWNANGEIIIPATYNDKPVTSIGEWAFYGCDHLTSVTIPNSVTTIGNDAFFWCDYLTSVTIPNSVTSIGEYAFYGCTRLSSVAIPDNVTTIGDYAFAYCPCLTSVTIPDRVTLIGFSAFRNCNSLTGIWVDRNNPNYSSDNFGVLLNKDKTVLYSAPGGLSGSYIIPESVTTIGGEAFYSCDGLTSVTIPDSVTVIGNSVFGGCERLSDVYYGGTEDQRQSISIGSYNDPLTSANWHYKEELYFALHSNGESYYVADCDASVSGEIAIPATYNGKPVTSIGEGAFQYCSSLTSITIPDSVTSIGGSAFSRCDRLTGIWVNANNPNYSNDSFGVLFNKDKTVLLYAPGGLSGNYHIPDGVTTIGNNAFLWCESMTSVSIPNSVTAIGEKAFYGCTSLTSLTIPDSVTTIGGQVFADCNGLTSVTIGNSVTSIGYGAFYSCDGLTSVTIPDSVTALGEYAFYWCTNLTGVTIPDSVTTISNYAFHWCDSLSVVLYRGTEVSRQSVSIGSYNSSLTAATWHYEVVDTEFAGQDCYYCAKCDNYFLPDGSYAMATVAFKDMDGTVISSKSYHYGDEVEIPADPTKAPDNTYIYAFAGWDKEIVNCTGDATYTATYSAIYIDYTVTFQDENGKTISEKTYHWGDKVEIPADPAKATDHVGSYSFAGWDKEVVNCAGNATYTATYKTTYIDYTIIFLNDDGSTISRKLYHWGDKVELPADPNKASDNIYAYTFAGWHKEVVDCAGDAIYKATYNAAQIEYTVTFQYADGTSISVATYYWGDKVEIPANPTKSADNTYTYAFAGWDKEIVDCAGNASYTATYTATYIDYTVKFLDENGETILENTYHWGDEVEIPENPVKQHQQPHVYQYIFDGWDQEVSIACKGNITYTATYREEYTDYTVVFKNWDGTVLSTGTYHWGDAVAEPADPTRVADNVYTYAFAGWDKEVVDCAGDTTYTAMYSSDYIDYMVLFLNQDGETICVKTYHWGDKVEPPVDPSIAADNTYSYTFAGWNKEVVNCAGDAVYTATYTPVYIDYTVTFVNEDGTIVSENTYHWGEKVEIPADPGKATDHVGSYVFAGWDKEIVNCAGDATYTATYKTTYIDYTVTFQYEDGTTIAQYTLHYGDEIVAPEDPAVPEELVSEYVFGGWDKAVTICTGNTVYTAVFRLPYPTGDVTKDNEVTNEDVIYLLWHTLFPETYPVDAQADFTGDGQVTNEDVIYLLWHTLFPESYPLIEKKKILV